MAPGPVAPGMVCAEDPAAASLSCAGTAGEAYGEPWTRENGAGSGDAARADAHPAAVVAAAVALFVRRVRPRVALGANARPTGRAAITPQRATRELTHVFLQRKLLQKLGPGLMHAFIFWGFIVLFLATVILTIDADIVRKPQSLLYVQALKFLQTKATPASQGSPLRIA